MFQNIDSIVKQTTMIYMSIVTTPLGKQWIQMNSERNIERVTAY
jgi:hypothetical protein